ncbi:MAG: VWA domain-containing protein [Acidobacteriia bacterium]|nr:VWA domain-containing protein [Terriglobia bacterium]
MLRRNKLLLALVSLVTLSVCLRAQSSPPSPGSPAGQQPAAEPLPGEAPSQPGSTVRVPAGGQHGQAPTREDNGVFVFKKQVEEVVLHATVVDDKHRLVTGLTKNDFQVFEDGAQQQITSFRREDIPVAAGIVIDNSGSMRDKRTWVNQASINFVRSSNPQDEVFIVNFNDEYYLDQDFTNQVPRLKEALERIESRGGTALYDAVVASADHLKKNARLEKKVLLVVTDGEDNASRESLEQAIRRLQAESGPTVYTIGLLGGEKQRRARRALNEMAEQTGGVAFFPKDVGEVDSITQAVAHDIRNQYTIGYKPMRSQTQGGYRTIRVDARAPGHKHLTVRTRSGYYPGQERAAK